MILLTVLRWLVAAATPIGWRVEFRSRPAVLDTNMAADVV